MDKALPGGITETRAEDYLGYEIYLLSRYEISSDKTEVTPYVAKPGMQRIAAVEAPIADQRPADAQAEASRAARAYIDRLPFHD